MGIMVYSLLWVVQDLYHKLYEDYTTMITPRHPILITSGPYTAPVQEPSKTLIEPVKESVKEA